MDGSSAAVNKDSGFSYAVFSGDTRINLNL
jgi:hypothetical protein